MVVYLKFSSRWLRPVFVVDNGFVVKEGWGMFPVSLLGKLLPTGQGLFGFFLRFCCDVRRYDLVLE